MLKPAVCRRELCNFAFSKLGLMADSVDGVAMQAEVVDLLVAMFKAAAFSGRAETVLEPFPLIFDPANPDEPVMNPEKRKEHLPLVKEVIGHVKVSSMVEVAKKNQGQSHPFAYPLMQWIVGSNRSHLVRLPEDKHLAQMGTKFQFLLLSAPPEQEEKFAEEKKKHGSVWAFHGSRTENWHCILRTGLRNASGTKLQLNGAAYGSGVYVSPSASMSLGYSQLHGNVSTNTGTAASGVCFLLPVVLVFLE